MRLVVAGLSRILTKQLHGSFAVWQRFTLFQRMEQEKHKQAKENAIRVLKRVSGAWLQGTLAGAWLQWKRGGKAAAAMVLEAGNI